MSFTLCFFLLLFASATKVCFLNELIQLTDYCLKCDEVRPSCTQCRKSSRVCPGYPDEFDLIFRNETAAVKRRAQRAFSNASSKSSPKAARYVIIYCHLQAAPTALLDKFSHVSSLLIIR